MRANCRSWDQALDVLFLAFRAPETGGTGQARRQQSTDLGDKGGNEEAGLLLIPSGTAAQTTQNKRKKTKNANSCLFYFVVVVWLAARTTFSKISSIRPKKGLSSFLLALRRPINSVTWTEHGIRDSMRKNSRFIQFSLYKTCHSPFFRNGTRVNKKEFLRKSHKPKNYSKNTTINPKNRTEQNKKEQTNLDN